MVNELSYCAQQVRRFDRERYLAALLCPAGRREAVFALLAFHLEVARIGDMVSEPMIGMIRLQWWREALQEIYAGSPARKHAVVEPLAAAITAHGLPQDIFEAILDARERDLEEAPFAAMAELETYLRRTLGNLHRLWLIILAPEADCREPVEQCAIAWGFVGWMRRMVHPDIRELLPLDKQREYGISEGKSYWEWPEEMRRKVLSDWVSIVVQIVPQSNAIHSCDHRASPLWLFGRWAKLYCRRAGNDRPFRRPGRWEPSDTRIQISMLAALLGPA